MLSAQRVLPGDDVEQWPADAVEVGRVLGAWGIKGGLKVQPHAADPQCLFSTKRWYLAAPEGPQVPKLSPTVGWPRVLRVLSARAQGDAIVATVHDLSSRDAAQLLAGARVHVPRSSFPSIGDDDFYWVDLIGLQVHNREGLHLGEVVGLQETGPHCVLRLSTLDSLNQQRMVPFVAAYVDGVDLARRRIDVDWPGDY